MTSGEHGRAARPRMTGTQRRQQLIEIGRALFAERGYDATSIEEIAQRAQVSKPVVYEHFGGKEGLYAVVVDREMSSLLDMITSSLTRNRSRVRLEQVALALLTYIEERTDGFRILMRDQPAAAAEGTYSSLLNDAVNQVAHILAGDFERRGLDTSLATLYAQGLVGMVATAATWWLDERRPSKEVVAAHLVNLCWNGLTHLEADPQLASEWPSGTGVRPNGGVEGVPGTMELPGDRAGGPAARSGSSATPSGGASRRSGGAAERSGGPVEGAERSGGTAESPGGPAESPGGPVKRSGRRGSGEGSARR